MNNEYANMYVMAVNWILWKFTINHLLLCKVYSCPRFNNVSQVKVVINQYPMQVTIVTRPEMTVFVRTFGGFAKDK